VVHQPPALDALGDQRDILLVNPGGGEVAYEGYKLRGQGALLRIVAGKANLITLSGGAAVTSGGRPVTAAGKVPAPPGVSPPLPQGEGAGG